MTVPSVPRDAADVETLVVAVRRAGQPLEPSALLEVARDAFGNATLPTAVVEQLLAQAVDAGALTIAANGTVTSPSVDGDTVEVPADETSAAPGPWKPQRAIAIDFETVARQIPDPPYVDRVPFQVGIVRFGKDDGWVKAAPRYREWIEVPTDVGELIGNEAARAQVLTGAQPSHLVAVEVARLLDDADVLVAYNGIEVDFPVLERLLSSADLDVPDIPQVDGLYLGHALWPSRHATSHRLFELAAHAGVDTSRMNAHDAGDDATVLARLVVAAAGRVAAWDDRLAELVGAAAGSTAAWRLIWTLAGRPDPPNRLSARQVRATVADMLEDFLPLRDPQLNEVGSDSLPPDDQTSRTPVEPQPIPLTIPGDLTIDGKVDPGRLIGAIRGAGQVETREAQSMMAARIRQATATGEDVLIEAPTGTGKTAAMLAAALDHLAADPANRVVISTYTKQLQAQLADDLQTLVDRDVVGGLAINVDLVKGARNRLSLRGLLISLSGLTGSGGIPPRLADQSRFRETVVYLLLRLLAAGPGAALSDIWDARSVDVADLPAFFDRYAEGQLPAWISDLSQGRAGDFRIDTLDPLAGHTRLAREAVRASRLVIANHALLFSNISAFEQTAATTLLLVDEAHRVEDAATSTFESTFDYAHVEAVAADLGRYAGIATGTAEQVAMLEATAARLEEFLEAEQLSKSVGHVVDVHVTADLLPGRQLRRGTVAAAEADAVTLRRGETVFAPLSRLRATMSDCWQALLGLPEPADPSTRDLHHGLKARLLDTLLVVAAIRRDLAALLGITLSAPDALLDPHSQATQVALDELGTDPEQQADDASSRVVWAAEQPSPEFASRGWRWFRFALAASPIALADEPRYRTFRATFPTSVFVSATLRIPGADEPWQFICDRLALDSAEVDAVQLPSPFDPASQARLICFEDFPSWVEHAEGAVRTVAHQLTGFARAVVDSDGNDGAMLLTTSRSAAAQISDLLLRRRAEAEGRYDIHSAVLTDNRTAVDRFKASGGILTGTKGLWQGVDIDDSRRLRLVWINKLPFGAVGDPVLEQRMARIRRRAETDGADDPDTAALTEFYLPLAAIDLRQAVGRLIRTREHRGVVVISDAKLGGKTVLRRTYRQFFLGSLDEGFLHRPGPDEEPVDPVDPWVSNVVPMEVGWRRIWTFLADNNVLPRDQAEQLCGDKALSAHVWLPQTRVIREQELTRVEEDELSREGQLAEVLTFRGAKVGGALRLSDGPVTLKPKQVEALEAVARGDDVLAVLPTGYGKSFTFQLPALVLPGVTIVMSPLVSLMTDQALHLNRTIGGAVRALTGPMRESNSRLGKAEVAEQLTDPEARHGIRIVYLSPERLAQRQFQEQIRTAVKLGIVRRIAIDEAHTLAQWGDDFRPQFRRAERFLRELRSDPELPKVQLIAVTATATQAVRWHLRRWLFDHSDPDADPKTVDRFTFVTANPIRADLAIYRRQLPVTNWSQSHYATVGLVEQILDALEGHAIIYAMTVREVDALHGYISEQVGTTRMVLRYHGRLPETEKSAVADAFINAPQVGDEAFKPMVVVATAAFGLGVDRPDIRSVLLASPPMDLAALYQQLGRAGRDQVGRTPDGLEHSTIAMALMTGRGWSTLRFFLEKRPEREQVLTDIARRILDAPSPYLDAGELGRAIMSDDVHRRVLSVDDLDNPHVHASYRTMVLRVFSALAATGHVEDHGDFPVKVSVRRGQITTGADAETAAQVLAATGSTRTAALLDIWAALPLALRGELGDVGALWAEMMLLHAAGYLDVSQRANIGYGMTTGYRKLRSVVDPDLTWQLMAHLRSAEDELAELKAWFDPAAGRCANQDLARYFAVAKTPDGTCAVPANRCSSCWDRADVAHQLRPPHHGAFFTHDPAPASKVAIHRRTQQARLDATITKLAALHRSGFTKALLKAVLRGEPTFPTRKGAMDVFPQLRLSRYYGAHPGTSDKPLQAALDRLAAAEILGHNDRGFWCHVRHLREASDPADDSSAAKGAREEVSA